MSDDITINFIGPSFNFRNSVGLNDNVHVLSWIALGYMSYKDEVVFLTPATLKSSTVGVNIGFGLDVSITENISLGVEASLLGGTLNHYEITDATGTHEVKLKEDEYENLARVDVSGGIRFNF